MHWKANHRQNGLLWKTLPDEKEFCGKICGENLICDVDTGDGAVRRELHRHNHIAKLRVFLFFLHSTTQNLPIVNLKLNLFCCLQTFIQISEWLKSIMTTTENSKTISKIPWMLIMKETLKWVSRTSRSCGKIQRYTRKSWKCRRRKQHDDDCGRGNHRKAEKNPGAPRKRHLIPQRN